MQHDVLRQRGVRSADGIWRAAAACGAGQVDNIHLHQCVIADDKKRRKGGSQRAADSAYQARGSGSQIQRIRGRWTLSEDHGEFWRIFQPRLKQESHVSHEHRWEVDLYLIPLQRKMLLELQKFTRATERTSTGGLHPFHRKLQVGPKVKVTHAEEE